MLKSRMKGNFNVHFVVLIRALGNSTQFVILVLNTARVQMKYGNAIFVRNSTKISSR